MKKNLFVVNTYFQLITVINLVLNDFKNEINDILLTDLSIDMDLKIEEIKASKLFRNVFFVNCKSFYKTKFKKIFLYVKNKEILPIDFDEYDELLFYNFNLVTHCIIDKLMSKNTHLKCSKFDEGLSTYTIFTPKVDKKYQIVRTLFRKKNINNIITKLYVYRPELLCYECDWKIEKIPNLDKNNIQLKNILNSIFQYKKTPIKQKYIFLEESFFCDNKDIDDLSIILKISQVVGKENLIIKLHPRNKLNRFKQYGIKTWKSTGIPWEVIQMNEDYNDKVLLTITSSSIFASKLYFNENIKSYLLYNCTNNKSDNLTDNFYKYIRKVENTIGLNNMYIPKDGDEFYKMLKNEVESDKK